MNGSHAAGPVGERLLPQVADAHAKFDPERIWASTAHSDISRGFRDVTFKELAHAVNYVAWWIDGKIGRSNDFETIAYMGVSDIRYGFMFLAAIKCGYKVGIETSILTEKLIAIIQILLPSIRNSVSGNVSLLKETKCTKFFCSTEMTSKVDDLKKEVGLESFTLPTFDEMLEERTGYYPYEVTFAEADTDPILICHTSGSTGSPKPIVLDHGYFGVYDNQRRLPIVEGRRNLDYSIFNFDQDGRFYSAFPPFHVAGVVGMCTVPLFYDATVVLPPPEKSSNGELACQIMHQVGASLRALFSPPTVIEQFLQEPGALQQAARLDFVLSAGGPLSPSAGDSLSKVTDVCQFIGSTEIGIIPALVPLRENWIYFEWHPTYGCQMQLVSEDIYECVIPFDPNLRWIRRVCRGSSVPETEEWRTKDLFRAHPSNSNLWRFHGRTDDIIVLSNGEKFNPVTMEGIVQGHPLLSGAIIVGQGRFQAALIVEPRTDTDSTAQESLIDEIWPFIKKANIEGPAHARIYRSKVMITSPRKPFQRVGKGTVIRGLTIKDYSSEIEALYSDEIAPKHRMNGMPELDAPYDPTALRRFVRMYVASVLTNDDSVVTDDSVEHQAITDNDDFFVHGLDSLQTVELAHGLRAGLKPYVNADLSWISSKTIYANPTVESLLRVLDSRSKPDSISQGDDTVARRIARMSALVEKYIEGLPRRTPNMDRVPHLSHDPLCVVLTGSTGTLGTNLLQALLEDPKVSKVYCLNRAADARQRHEKSFSRRGVKYHLENVEFLKADFGHPQFALPSNKFTELMNEVNIIIHNAWKVDFNHSLDSFEAVHIRGVRNFVDWSIVSKQHPHIFFVSSISSVGNWTAHHKGPVPESPLNDFNVAQVLGYGESKHVSERILQIANARSGVSASILRVGQVAGPLTVNGTEWH